MCVFTYIKIYFISQVKIFATFRIESKLFS